MAAAYGIAVTVTMLITTMLTFFVVRDGWGIPAPVAYFATGVFSPSTSCSSPPARPSSSRAAGSRS
jgi:hypothetical protein